MNLKNKKITIIIFGGIIVIGIACVLFTKVAKVNEGFSDRGTPDTSHTVNLPLTTTTSCSNFCGPQSQCAKTRDQCTSDVDCPGCQPVLPPENKELGPDVPGQNDAGKASFSAPQYSTLTTDMGTQAAFYYPAGPLESGSKTAQVAVAQLGSGPTNAGKEGQRLFNKKNAYLRHDGESRWTFEPKYPDRESATGMFLDEDGPLAANSYL